MPIWRKYVDDTFTLVKKGKKEEVIRALNNFRPNIKFTHETEKDGQIPFLDVIIKRLDRICAWFSLIFNEYCRISLSVLRHVIPSRD